MTSPSQAAKEPWDPVAERLAHDRLQAALFGVPSRPPRLDRYVVGHKLGEGGSGVVYQAHDPQLDRAVAIKLLRRPAARGRDRLEREARALARLDAPHVVKVYDVGRTEHQGRSWVFVVMERVEGVTLREWLAQLRPPQDVLVAMLQAASGLAAAHRAGLVHRDFKPSNVMIDRGGHVKILDLGIATQAPSDKPATSSSADPGLTADGSATQTHGRSGTPAYMAPEQRRGEGADARSDQYSFCLTLLEGWTGQRPEPEARTPDIVGPRLRACGIPRAHARAVLRGMSTEPARRFADMDALRRALLRPSPARRWGPVAAVGIVSAVTVAGAWAVDPPASAPASPGATAGCPPPDAPLWSSATAQRVRTAFLATEHGRAATNADHVDRQASRFATAWTQASAEASTTESSSRPAICRCLARQAAVAEALRGKWLHATADDVTVAPYDTGELGRPAACLAAAPRPPSPLSTEHHATLVRRLDRLHGARHLGDLEQTTEAAAALRRELEPWGDRWLLAEVDGLLADLYGQRGAFDDAERHAALSFEEAVAVGHDDQAAWAATKAVQIVGGAQGRPADAQVWLRHATAAVERADDPLARGALQQGEAFMHERQGAFDAAIAAGRAAAETFSDALGPEHPRTAAALHAVGTAQYNARRHAAARETLTRVRTILERSLGAEHLDVCKVVFTLATIASATGDTARAETEFRTVIDTVSTHYGPEHETAAAAWQGLGHAIVARAPEQAVAYAVRGAESFERAYGPDHPHTGDAWFNVGVIGQAADPPRAHAAFKRALRAAEATFGPDHRAVLAPLGALRTLVSDPVEAAALRRRGVALCRALNDPPECAAFEAPAGDEGSRP